MGHDSIEMSRTQGVACHCTSERRIAEPGHRLPGFIRRGVHMSRLPRRLVGAALASAVSLALCATASPAAALNTQEVGVITDAYHTAADAAGQSTELIVEPMIPVTVPTNAATGVSIGDSPEAIRIFPDPAAASGDVSKTADGLSVYGGSGGVSTIVERNSAGASIATVAARHNGVDQQTFHYRLSLPAGHSLRTSGDGGADIVASDGTVRAKIAAPWARDANGTSLQSSYTIDGDTLSQTINTAAAVFPVVADPRLEILYQQILGRNAIPRALKVWLTRRETESLWAIKYPLSLPVAAANIICGQVKKLPNAVRTLGKYVDVVVGLACLAITAGPYADLVGNLDQAHNKRNCLTFEAGLRSLLTPNSTYVDFNDGRGRYCKP